MNFTSIYTGKLNSVNIVANDDEDVHRLSMERIHIVTLQRKFEVTTSFTQNHKTCPQNSFSVQSDIHVHACTTVQN